MVKVTIERNGEVTELQGDAVFGGVITKEEDSTGVTAFLIGRICEQDVPVIMAKTMCRLAKRTCEDKDVPEQMNALISFGSTVDEIVKREVDENREACDEAFRRLLRKVFEEV